ncbi:MAG: TatD family hydrolase [Rectinemataceae bacterium]|nr:TatD family hydrolase [Rectinemataceae bacterium]
MMLVDSHCHPDFQELAQRIDSVVENMRKADVRAALCVGVTLERFPALLEIVRSQPCWFAAVGVHPDTHEEAEEPTTDTLNHWAADPKVIAIGETGLDYYRTEDDKEKIKQQNRFKVHIEVAQQTKLPLIIHTRSAQADTLDILAEGQGSDCGGGVFHCFTEDIAMARRILDMGFYISLSGIVTFKNSLQIKEVAKFVPLDRLLIETDAPYLAPVPHRGKTNEPAYVRYVAEEIARLRDIPLEVLAASTTDNFFRLFHKATCPNA